jgi:hypothetical protein
LTQFGRVTETLKNLPAGCPADRFARERKTTFSGFGYFMARSSRIGIGLLAVSYSVLTVRAFRVCRKSMSPLFDSIMIFTSALIGTSGSHPDACGDRIPGNLKTIYPEHHRKVLRQVVDTVRLMRLLKWGRFESIAPHGTVSVHLNRSETTPPNDAASPCGRDTGAAD